MREVEQLKKDAQILASRVKDEKPASGEARQVLQAAQRIQEGVARPPTPEVQQAFQAIFKPLQTIAQASACRPPSPDRRRSEDAADGDVVAPVAAEVEAATEHHRPNQGIGEHPDADVAVEVGVVDVVEGRPVLEPAAEID